MVVGGKLIDDVSVYFVIYLRCDGGSGYYVNVIMFYVFVVFCIYVCYWLICLNFVLKLVLYKLIVEVIVIN